MRQLIDLIGLPFFLNIKFDTNYPQWFIDS